MKRRKLQVPPEDRKLPQRPKAEIRSELATLTGLPVEHGKPAGRPTTLWMRSKGWKGAEQEATVFVRTAKNCDPANGWGRKAIIPKGMNRTVLFEPRLAKNLDGSSVRVLITAEERSGWNALRAAEPNLPLYTLKPRAYLGGVMGAWQLHGGAPRLVKR